MRWIAVVVALAACGDNRTIAAGDAPDDLGRCTPVHGNRIVMRQIATFEGGIPLLATAPQGDPRLFVITMDGRILIVEPDGHVREEPFLDLSADVVCCGERGLLGLAFHPDYANTGTFYVFYTNATQNILARFQRSDDNHADPNGTTVLAIDDPFSNHNGGMMEFGADGMLYVGTGDGGGIGDPMSFAPDPFNLFGKMLRLDVDAPAPGMAYGIPLDNPFADGVAGAPEVFMLGLRNPWRWSLDPETGDFWIGDVGQDLFEELDHVPAGTARGADLGWSHLEGNGCFREPCDTAGKLPPVAVRTHATDGWCSVIGGQTYRGECFPDLRGTHFFTDYCAHVLEGARIVNGKVRVQRFEAEFVNLDGFNKAEFPVTPSSLHADGFGELYLTTVTCCGSSSIGGLYRLEATR